MHLGELGWDDALAAQFAPWRDRSGVQPGRVAIEFNHNYRVYVEGGEIEAVAAGRLKHRAASRAELPAVGDWVAVRKRPDEDRGAIQAILPRRSRFSRRAAGNVTGEQVVAANVDVVFLVMGLDDDFSVRRLERYVLLARESGAAPVILLTKPDLAGNLPAQVAEVVSIAGDLPVHVVSPKKNEGLEQVGAYLPPGRTGALLGSSGVGKSTIINRLIGQDVRKTQEVRASDSKGRHTTMHRELVVLPGGGLIIDTPGMRELQLWDVNEAVRETFDEIEALAPGCYFSDCRHREEPRCAVKAAVEAGQVPAARYESYLKLQDEMKHLAAQQDERARLEEKRQGKLLAKTIRARLRAKGRK
ncbi:MAG: ribosome small subunit-dependent GTPase A [Vicinamibacterales bacterium]